MGKTSKYRGIYWSNTLNKWKVSFRIEGRRHSFGSFDCEDDAYRHLINIKNYYGISDKVVDIEGEKWMSIPDLLGDGYMVSNKGRVKSLDYNKTGVEKVLAQIITYNGYCTVNPRGARIWFVHRLVAHAFIGISDLCVNHKDGDRQNNCVENLEYVTRRENTTHGLIRKTGRFRGCHYDKKTHKWSAMILINKKYIYLGQFEQEDMARQAYLDALNRYGLSNKYA